MSDNLLILWRHDISSYESKPILGFNIHLFLLYFCIVSIDEGETSKIRGARIALNESRLYRIQSLNISSWFSRVPRAVLIAPVWHCTIFRHTFTSSKGYQTMPLLLLPRATKLCPSSSLVRHAYRLCRILEPTLEHNDVELSELLKPKKLNGIQDGQLFTHDSVCG